MNAVMDFLFENQNFQLLKMILGLCLFLFGMSLMGEALERRAGSALRTILGNMQRCKEDIAQWRPDVVILIDYPSFNLRVAKYVKTVLGIK